MSGHAFYKPVDKLFSFIIDIKLKHCQCVFFLDQFAFLLYYGSWFFRHEDRKLENSFQILIYLFYDKCFYFFYLVICKTVFMFCWFMSLFIQDTWKILDLHLVSSVGNLLSFNNSLLSFHFKVHSNSIFCKSLSFFFEWVWCVIDHMLSLFMSTVLKICIIFPLHSHCNTFQPTKRKLHLKKKMKMNFLPLTEAERCFSSVFSFHSFANRKYNWVHNCNSIWSRNINFHSTYLRMMLYVFASFPLISCGNKFVFIFFAWFSFIFPSFLSKMRKKILFEFAVVFAFAFLQNIVMISHNLDSHTKTTTTTENCFIAHK